MLKPLIVLLLLFIPALSAGLLILRLSRLRTSLLERMVYAPAFGLGIIAYLTLAIGLSGRLYVPWIVGMLVIAFISGLPELLNLIKDLIPAIKYRMCCTRPSFFEISAAILLGSCCAISLIHCFVPPGGHEWDTLAYHLAAPQVYLAQHKILFLPTDHHTNFPFLLEMLYTVGLLFDGWRLANLIHLLFWALTIAAIFLTGRCFVRGAGWIAALTFCSAPVVIWEAGTAYIELGMTLYVLLGIYACLRERDTGDLRWIAICGIAMGLALGVKTLAIIPAALIGLMYFIHQRTLKRLAIYLLMLIIVGSPFYIKSWVYTGNPVYPFAYRVFGGIYWNQALSDTYSSEQRSFGVSHQITSASEDSRGILPTYIAPTIADRLRNIIMGPWQIITLPRLFYNYNDSGPFNHIGFLFLAILVLPLLMHTRSSHVKYILWIISGWYLCWSISMQYIRYIIPMLPLIGLVGGEGAVSLVRREPVMRWVLIGVILLQFGLTLSVFVPPLFAVDRSPGFIAIATDLNLQEQYLNRSVNVYPAEIWINRNSSPSDGVTLFEENRGFYLERPTIWGNEGHSLYIPYDKFHTGKDMSDWYLDHGYRFALVNLQFNAHAQTPEGAELLKQSVSESTETKLLARWYTGEPGKNDTWRDLLGDALKTGHAVPVFSARGAVVLEFKRR